mgnify:FL=1
MPSSYRTYEEWKLLDTAFLTESGRVLTVPMRNGNGDIRSIFTVFGIVLTVPMRNGNSPIAAAASDPPIPVLTVPMRNGNNGIRYIFQKAVLSSYRTYEEWKQQFS